MENFVNVVGFQLEKVHTGIIKWCLESSVGEPLTDLKYKLMSNLYSHIGVEVPFSQNAVIEVKCIPEYSFGRRLKVDLLIEISTQESKYYFACEMKVDSEPYKTQLDQTVLAIQNEFGNFENNQFLLILIGASSVMREVGDQHEDFVVVVGNDLLNIFDCYKDESYISSCWLDTIEEELERKNNALSNFLELHPDMIWSKDGHKSLGYRPFFSIYYYLYSQLREHFTLSSEWSIYSGSNNPVMNWNNGWKTVNNFKFYWEFNYVEYCFKVQINTKVVTRDKLNNLRDAVCPILEQAGYEGWRSQRRYGEYNSLFKWNFDLQNQSFSEISRLVENDIHSVYSAIIDTATTV